MLRRITPAQVETAPRPTFDAVTRARVAEIIAAVETGGDRAIRDIAIELGDLDEDAPLVLDRSDCERARAELAPATVDVLERTAERIRQFAQAQRAALAPIDVAVDGGRAGHDVSPVDVAGCYAPGGRYPLPSSVLMTAVTARVAGVRTVIVASPRPQTTLLAAAAIAGADHVITVGGAQAIAALAFGTSATAPSDVIVGPGNRWVSAAKMQLSGRVGIDMVAGPSELVVLADDSADPEIVAADLIAQAEHDVDARPILIATSAAWADAVDAALARQLETLSTRATAVRAMQNGFTCICPSIDSAVEVCNRIAPEHLEVMLSTPLPPGALRHYGGLFLGAQSAEVFGDYGIGPNHVLPTGGAARSTGGLSVLDFLRVRTWLDLERLDATAVDDSIAIARIEGLEGHARAAELRRP